MSVAHTCNIKRILLVEAVFTNSLSARKKTSLPPQIRIFQRKKPSHTFLLLRTRSAFRLIYQQLQCTT